MALAAVALAGCATGSPYYGAPQPAYSYHDDAFYHPDPYYGGFGHGAYFYDFDDDDHRYFRPARNVTCDRARDICYDRDGPSYQATKRYLGEREANRSYKKYGDRVFLFSPKKGVTCDRRTETCSKGRWTERVFEGEPSRRQRNEARDRPSRLLDDDASVGKRLLRLRRQRLADQHDADLFARPSKGGQPEGARRLLLLPKQPNKEKPGNK